MNAGDDGRLPLTTQSLCPLHQKKKKKDEENRFFLSHLKFTFEFQAVISIVRYYSRC